LPLAPAPLIIELTESICLPFSELTGPTVFFDIADHLELAKRPAMLTLFWGELHKGPFSLEMHATLIFVYYFDVGRDGGGSACLERFEVGFELVLDGLNLA